MPFTLETLPNPNDLINPDSLSTMLNINYNQTLIDATNAFDSNSENFVTLKSTLNLYVSNLFEKYNTLIADSQLLPSNLTSLKSQLDTLKINNESLKQELDHIYELGDGSDELINDYKQVYNINYTRNWGIFASIFFSWYMLSTIFKSKPMKI